MHQDLDKSEYLKNLQSAFEQFNKRTEHLASAYNSLKKRASEIDKELERKNIQLEKKNIQLKRTTRFLDSLVRSMQSALVAIDGRKRIETVNPVATHLFGVKEKDVRGKYIKKISSFKPLWPLIDSTISGFPVTAREVHLSENPFKTGEPMLVEVSTSRMIDKNDLLGVLIIIRDMTELRELRDSVIRNENLAMLGQMAVTVAHEIRNPLGGVEGFAALLRKDLEEDHKKRELADKILLGTRDLNSFITNLLDFARPLKVVRKKERLSDIMDKAISFSMNYPKDNPSWIKIRKTYESEIIHPVDGHLLFRLLLNLLLNAYEAMEGKGTCKIKISKIHNIKRMKKADKIIKSLNYREDKPFAAFSVKDTGPGIERDFLEKIFNPFVTSKAFGTGLGLSMVQKIMEAFNGRIDIITSEEKGTEFKFYIPLEG